MAKVSTARRRALAEAQNWRCAYCSVVMEVDAAHPLAATVDHVAPRAVGGRDSRLNLVAACKSCNGARGADIDIWTFNKVRVRLLEAGVWAPGTAPPDPVRRFLRAHRELTRAKLALRRLAFGAGATSSELLIGDLVDTLNDGCTLMALQITHLPRRRSGCQHRLAVGARYATAVEERLPWACLWGEGAHLGRSPDDLDLNEGGGEAENSASFIAPII